MESGAIKPLGRLATASAEELGDEVDRFWDAVRPNIEREEQYQGLALFTTLLSRCKAADPVEHVIGSKELAGVGT